MTTVASREERRCALPGCDRALPSESSPRGPRRLYCCDAHRSLASKRRRRERVAANVPILFTGAICPIDGRVFAIELFGRRRGRPRKYDCDVCREIARQIRELKSEE